MGSTMALVSNRPPGHPPPGMPDYDDLCDDYTYDELTDGMSTCSGSVNDILDDINVDDLRDSRDLDNLDLDDLTIPDVIKLPSMNGNVKQSNGYSQQVNNKKYTDYSNSKKTQESLFGRIFQTNASVHSQNGSTKEHPIPSAGINNPFEDPDSENMLGEYMSKVQDRSEREKDKKLIVTEPKKFVELADKTPVGEKCILSESMQTREAKFNNLTDSASENNGSGPMSENRRLSQSSRFSQTSLGSQQNFRNAEQNNYNSQKNGNNGSTVNSLNRNKTCPSPSFDARVFKNAKWQSTEDVSFKDPGSLNLPQTWTPRNNPSPSPDKKDFKPVSFDSNSLKRSKRSISTDSGSTNLPPPTDSFAWKDNTLDRQLKELKEKQFSDAPDPRAGRDGANDKGLNKSLQNWASTPLPKAEDPDVILLKKARQEKKVKRYLEDNFQNREGHYASEPESNYDSDIGDLSSKYTSLDRRRDDEPSSPPKSPPPFSKAESRFEREQRIRVGSLDSYTPGSTLSREKSLSPPPAVSAAQKKYERERFRVEPGRIENYTLGRGSLANQEVYKAGLATSASGCGITKYSSSHSFNPLLLSKSAHNLSVKKGSPSDGQHLQKTLKDGYESDSTLVYRKHPYTPCASPSPQAKALYTQIQKGGDVPLQGLRMQAPEKKDEEEALPTHQKEMIDEENIKPNEQEIEEGSHEITGEIEVFSTQCDDDDDDIINLDDNSPNNEDEFILDDDPGFVIVTEDKGTNCPSINGSLRKENKATNVPSVNGSSYKGSSNGKESEVKEDEGEANDSSLPPAAPKRQNKRWSKLMKYTLPSKNPDPKSPKNDKKAKDRKSLKDKMKENDFVVFLTERRAVSESRFRVLDKIGSPGKLVRTKSDQSVDESWNTVMSTPFDDIDGDEEIEEIKFEILDDSKDDGADVHEEVDARASAQELSKSSGSSSSKINESSQDSGNDERKSKQDRKGEKGKKSKEKKEKKKQCDICTTEKEHREHRKEKKRAKKEKQDRKREKEASL